MDDLALTLLEYVKLALFLGNIAIAAFVVFHRSRTAQSGGDAAADERRVGPVLFVIAHPDDEAMFFAPSILALARAGRPIHLLCLSTGDYEGGPSAGKVRTKELYASASGVLGIERGRITVVDDEQLRDGPLHRWSPDRIARIVADHVARVDGGGVETIITFDEGGVSAHPNHIAVYHGVARFLATMHHQNPSSSSTASSTSPPSSSPSSSSTSAAAAPTTTLTRRAASTSSPGQEGEGKAKAELRGFKLETTNVVRKYVGLVDVVWSSLTSSGELFVAPGWCFWSAHRAMQAHASQYVWFRRLYVPFSRYSYINTLLPITTTSATPSPSSPSS